MNVDDDLIMESSNTGIVGDIAAASNIDDFSAMQRSIGSNEQIIILSGGGGANENIDVEAMAVEKTNRQHDSRDEDDNNSNDAENLYTTTPSKPAVHRRSAAAAASGSANDNLDVPKVLPLRPIIRGPYDDDGDGGTAGHQVDSSVVYAEPHTEVQLNCDVDLDVVSSEWRKDGQVSEFVHNAISGKLMLLGRARGEIDVQ